MSRKEFAQSAETPGGALREELERLGVAPEEAGRLAARLRDLPRALPSREYRALLEGLALGYRAAPASRTPGLERILDDFAAELKKLDEGLRVVTAYLARLRERAETDPERTLH